MGGIDGLNGPGIQQGFQLSHNLIPSDKGNAVQWLNH